MSFREDSSAGTVSNNVCVSEKLEVNTEDVSEENSVNNPELLSPENNCDDKRKLFVGGLNYLTNNRRFIPVYFSVEELSKYFKKFGEVESCTVKFDKISGHPRGFGFVIFKEESSVKKVLNKAEHILGCKKIDIKLAKPTKDPISLKKVFVGGLDPDINSEDISDSQVVSVDLPFDSILGKRKGYVFVAFATEEEAKKAASQEKQDIYGCNCDVRVAVSKDQKFRSNVNNHVGMYGTNPDIHQIILNLANSSLGANNNFIRPQNLPSVPIPTHDPQLYIHQPHFTNLFAARLAQGLTLNNVAQAGLNSGAPNVHSVQSSRFAVPHSHPNQIYNRINDIPPSDYAQNVFQFSPAVTQPQYMTFPVSQPFANPGPYYPTQANQGNVSNQSTNNTIPNTYNGILVAPPVATGQPLISTNNQHAYVVHHGQFINQPQSQTSANEFLTHSVNGTNVSHSDTLLNSNPGVSTHLPVVQTIQGIPPQVAPQYNPAHIAPGMNSFFTSLGEFQVTPNIENNPNPNQPHLFSAPSGIAPNQGVAGPRTILPQNHHPSFNQPNIPHAGIYQHQGAYPNASFRLPQHPLLQPKVATNGPPIPNYPLRGVPHFNMGQINSQMLNNSPILKGMPRFIGFKLAGQPIVSNNSGLHSNIGVSSTSNNGVSVESTVSSVRSEDRIMPAQINE